MDYELLKKRLKKDVTTFFITAVLLFSFFWLINGQGWGALVWTPLIYILAIIVLVYFAKALVGSIKIVFLNQTPKELRLSYLFLAILLTSLIVVFAFLAIQHYGGLGNFVSQLHTPSP